MGRRKYARLEDSLAAAAVYNRRWHYQFSPCALPWRVIADGTVKAVFADERDARGFAKARYGDEAVIERRRGKGGRPRKEML